MRSGQIYEVEFVEIEPSSRALLFLSLLRNELRLPFEQARESTAACDCVASQLRRCTRRPCGRGMNPALSHRAALWTPRKPVPTPQAAGHIQELTNHVFSGAIKREGYAKLTFSSLDEAEDFAKQCYLLGVRCRVVPPTAL